LALNGNIVINVEAYNSTGGSCLAYVDDEYLEVIYTKGPSEVLTRDSNWSYLFVSNNVGIGTNSPGALLDIGSAGTTLGTLRLEGDTSGYVQLQSAAAAGSWTMTLPPGTAGTNGFQLTSATAGSGVTTWAAAASSPSSKNIIGLFGEPSDALTQIINANVYRFHYKPGMGTGDTETEYVGVMADEAPWAMHYGGAVVNPVNTLGYMVLGIQALDEKIATLSGQINNLNLTSTGDLNIEKIAGTDQYTVRNTKDNTLINQVGAFAEVVAANIRAGAITTEQLATDGLTAFTATIDNLLINNGLVSPVVQTNLISPLADSTDVVIKVGKIKEDGTSGFGELIIKDATGSAVASIDSNGSAEFKNASVSGELYAESIVSPDLDKIQELLRQVKEDQDLLAQAASWNTSTTLSATDSAQIVSSLSTTDLYVTNQAAISSLSVSNSLAVGTDLVIQALGTSGLGNSIDTLTAPLKLQSLAMAPVEIMAGKIRIETNGDVTIAGNVEIAGNLNVKGTISGKEVTTEKLIIASTQEATPSGSINPGEINTNATAGTATIPAGISEIIITNPNVSDYSLIYATPTSTTENNVLFVKSKETGKFVVGFTSPIDIDVTFNWWVIEAKTESGN
jgi:hypothetical protein